MLVDCLFVFASLCGCLFLCVCVCVCLCFVCLCVCVVVLFVLFFFVFVCVCFAFALFGCLVGWFWFVCFCVSQLKHVFSLSWVARSTPYFRKRTYNSLILYNIRAVFNNLEEEKRMVPGWFSQSCAFLVSLDWVWPTYVFNKLGVVDCGSHLLLLHKPLFGHA